MKTKNVLYCSKTKKRGKNKISEDKNSIKATYIDEVCNVHEGKPFRDVEFFKESYL
jgi:hypothetical protein